MVYHNEHTVDTGRQQVMTELFLNYIIINEALIKN